MCESNYEEGNDRTPSKRPVICIFDVNNRHFFMHSDYSFSLAAYGENGLEAIRRISDEEFAELSGSNDAEQSVFNVSDD